MRGLVERVAKYAAGHPDKVLPMVLADDFGPLHALIGTAEPGYSNKGECFNCGHSMELKVYTADSMDAFLLLEMAKVVRETRKKGRDFTQSNIVHIPSLETTHAIKCRSTQLSYLGFIAQPDKMSGTGNWVITGWGWEMLRGESKPREALYWRGKLIERSKETIDLAQMMKIHVDKVQKTLARGKAVQEDFRAVAASYKPEEWVGFGGYAEDMQPTPRVPAAPEPEPWYNKN